MFSRVLMGSLALLFIASSALADQRWQRVSAVTDALGGKEPVLEGLTLDLPLVAEDGSSVALTVALEAELAEGEHLSSVQLFAPGNPRPEVARFDLSPLASPLNIATRIRLSESQQVVAVATTSTGRAFLATRDVRVTVSGCLAGDRGGRDMTMSTPRVALAGTPSNGQPVAVRTLINHPMETGLLPGGEPAPDIKQQLVQTLTVTMGGDPVIKARFFTGISANPYVQFQMTPTSEGQLALTWQDQNGDRMDATQDIRF
ncbi:MAG: thiosulfate oxidation carrier protein SoxY [Pseudomonadota bacterium]|nr:thiosulfate oxidation carrier protein SoxY [Pseudomonadota bacterium]